MVNQVLSASIRRVLLGLFCLVVISAGFLNKTPAQAFVPIVAIVSLFIVVLLHGKERYGWKNILIFFCITFIISNFFEALSIRTGFPFGFYVYDKLIGPRIFDVPLIIMPTYFAMGYASWTLAHILVKDQKLITPLIATFIMVMWDLCIDPIFSHPDIDSFWIWKEPGSYFGVPLQNYFGWFLVVYLIFQTFAIFISRYKIPVYTSKLFWFEMIIVYGTQGLLQFLNLLTQNDHMEIFGPMALITLFTMIFVVFVSSYVLISRQMN